MIYLAVIEPTILEPEQNVKQTQKRSYASQTLDRARQKSSFKQ